jgi:hypothetical protein
MNASPFPLRSVLTLMDLGQFSSSGFNSLSIVLADTDKGAQGFAIFDLVLTERLDRVTVLFQKGIDVCSQCLDRMVPLF